MRVLLLGSGGRESAMAAALAKSPSVRSLFALPGNPGIAQIAETLGGDPARPGDVVDVARRVDADLVVVGPEAPLVAGVADALRDESISVFGPVAAAAAVEGSKSFAKEVMRRAGVFVPRWKAFSDVAPAVEFMDELGPPYVVKADGLAAGKGVVVTSDRSEAVEALEQRLVRRSHGEAGATVVIEEFLDGPEISLIALTDGHNVVPCEPAQDYKRAFDGDAGPNTGGMGSYSPVPVCPPETTAEIVEEVVVPVVRAIGQTPGSAPFVGALYAGLVLTADGPRVLEFNARFGDPETQALLPRLRSDFAEACLAAARGDLGGARLTWTDDVCVAVVLASKGYPGPYAKGLPIAGLDVAAAMDEVHVFHAGTALGDDGVVTAGGRVLAVSALGQTFSAARSRAYRAAAAIDFDGKHIRTDIGLKAETLEGAKL